MRAVTRSRSEPNVFAQELFDGLPRRYDALEATLSLGQNHRWRTAMVDAVTASRPPPRRILDVATGTAGVAIMLADRTDAEVVGIDLTEAMLRTGRARVAGRGLSDRVALLGGRAEQLPFDDATFDALTFTYLLRYVDDPAATLVELARVVRPGGTIAMLEFGVPRGIWRPAWNVWVGVGLPVAGRLISPGWHDVGRFLGPSIRSFHETYPEPVLLASWRAAGVENVRRRDLSLGGGVVLWGVRGDAT